MLFVPVILVPPPPPLSLPLLHKLAVIVEGIPNNQVTLKQTGKKTPRLHGSLVSLAEYGSFGVEFYALTQRTGNASYAEAAENIYRYMLPDVYNRHGLPD